MVISFRICHILYEFFGLFIVYLCCFTESFIIKLKWAWDVHNKSIKYNKTSGSINCDLACDFSYLFGSSVITGSFNFLRTIISEDITKKYKITFMDFMRLCHKEKCVLNYRKKDHLFGCPFWRENCWLYNFGGKCFANNIKDVGISQYWLRLSKNLRQFDGTFVNYCFFIS